MARQEFDVRGEDSGPAIEKRGLESTSSPFRSYYQLFTPTNRAQDSPSTIGDPAIHPRPATTTQQARIMHSASCEGEKWPCLVQKLMTSSIRALVTSTTAIQGYIKHYRYTTTTATATTNIATVPIHSFMPL